MGAGLRDNPCVSWCVRQDNTADLDQEQSPYIWYINFNVFILFITSNTGKERYNHTKDNWAL